MRQKYRHKMHLLCSRCTFLGKTCCLVFCCAPLFFYCICCPERIMSTDMMGTSVQVESLSSPHINCILHDVSVSDWEPFCTARVKRIYFVCSKCAINSRQYHTTGWWRRPCKFNGLSCVKIFRSPSITIFLSCFYTVHSVRTYLLKFYWVTE